LAATAGSLAGILHTARLILSTSRPPTPGYLDSVIPVGVSTVFTVRRRKTLFLREKVTKNKKKDFENEEEWKWGKR
jgi:adenylate cyclase